MLNALQGFGCYSPTNLKIKSNVKLCSTCTFPQVCIAKTRGENLKMLRKVPNFDLLHFWSSFQMSRHFDAWVPSHLGMDGRPGACACGRQGIKGSSRIYMYIYNMYMYMYMLWKLLHSQDMPALRKHILAEIENFCNKCSQINLFCCFFSFASMLMSMKRSGQINEFDNFYHNSSEFVRKAKFLKPRLSWFLVRVHFSQKSIALLIQHQH